jgi:3-phenylpropionate/cinnamic acid dioxygenase small subunit
MRAAKKWFKQRAADMAGIDEDREKVRELYARYTLSLDEGRFEEWVNCFTPDGTFESAWVGRLTGRTELLKRSSDNSALANLRLRHITSDLVFKLDGDTGTGRCNVTFFITREGTIVYVGVGYYSDLLQKIADDWYFANRVERLDTAKPDFWV